MSDPTPPVDPRMTARMRPRIWVMPCAFKKNGFPSLGSFGKSVANVVIVPLETWQRLCAEIPELGQRQFEVGANHDE